MGKYGFFFFSEEIAQLEAFKKTLTNADEIAEVDRQIEELRVKQAEAEHSVSDR